MLLLSLLLIPLITIFIISLTSYKEVVESKTIALGGTIINLFVSLIIFIFYQFSSNQFQFVQEYHSIGNFDLYLGVDGLSIYFVILTTIIMPIALLSN